MQLDATLQTVFQVAVGLCILLMIAGFFVGSLTDRGSKAALGIAIVVLLLDAALVFGTRSLAAKRSGKIW